MVTNLKTQMRELSPNTGSKLNILDVLDVFWTSYARSIYTMCPGGDVLNVVLSVSKENKKNLAINFEHI